MFSGLCSARELSVAEIVKIRQQTSMQLEVFVHGALCVAYSGQCLTSESLGGRSANRGQCAQACRLPYELICDDEDIDLGDKKYLLSPRDLAAYALVPELIAAGAVALKIEGRLKTPEYVANITRHYRQAIDSALAGRPVEFAPRQVEEMELSFSRGFSVGWLHGCDHKALVSATSSAKQGILIGQVQDVQQGRVFVKLCEGLSGGLKAGDGIVFEGDRAAGQEQGGRIYALRQRGRRVTEEVNSGVVEVTLHRNPLDLQRLWAGQKVWKSDDPALTRRLRKSFVGEITGRDMPVEIVATARVGEPLRLVVRTEGNVEFQCTSGEPLAEAIKHPLTREILQQQLGRLGGTGFALAALTATVEGTPMVPLSVLGKLRRKMVERLQAARATSSPPLPVLADSPVLPQMRQEIQQPANPPGEPQLSVLCRSLVQLCAMLEHGVPVVYADFQDIREYREAVAAARTHRSQIGLATPRILKPGEAGMFRALRDTNRTPC